MQNLADQTEQKIPSATAWILCGVVIFSGVHTLFSFMFTLAEFGLWYAKTPVSVLTIWKGVSIPLNALVTIIVILVIANRLKNARNLPKIFTILMGILWLVLSIVTHWMYSTSGSLRSAAVFDEDFRTYLKVENAVYMLNNLLYILTVFIGFLIFMNRKQQIQQ